MTQTIGTWMLGKARIEISAEEHRTADGPYQLTLTLPDTSVVVTGVTKDELLGLSGLAGRLEKAGEPIERWDGQSGG